MKSLLILVFIGFGYILHAQPDLGKLERRDIGGKVSVLVPSTFTLMPDNEVAQRYPSSTKPLAVFTSGSRSADFGVNKGKTMWAEGDLKIVKDFYKANMQTFYNKVTFLKEDIISVGSLKMVELKFIGEIESLGKGKSRRYVHVRYAIVKNRLYILQFNCPTGEQNLYQTVVDKMMNSVRIRKQGDIEQQSSGKKNKLNSQSK